MAGLILNNGSAFGGWGIGADNAYLAKRDLDPLAPAPALSAVVLQSQRNAAILQQALGLAGNGATVAVLPSLAVAQNVGGLPGSGVTLAAAGAVSVASPTAAEAAPVRVTAAAAPASVPLAVGAAAAPPPAPAPAAVSAAPAFAYVIGGLFPLWNGQPNVVTSSSIHYDPATRTFVGDAQLGALDVALNITTAPVVVAGMDRYLRQWFIPQITFTDSSKPGYQSGLFYTYWQAIIGQYTKKTRANIIADLAVIGYTGLYADQGASTEPYFSERGKKGDPLLAAISNVLNYSPAAVWAGYDEVAASNQLNSFYDLASLRANLQALSDPLAHPHPPLWYPSLLYTYQQPGRDATTPGPLLMMRPGEALRIPFSNAIKIGDLSPEELQQSTLVPISTYGNTSSNGLAGATTTNFHLHGMHINPAGFGDNVVARYTSGQAWTTIMQIGANQAQGSYWYHPHYHPSVNGQVYGGLVGFLQMGDPLAKVPAFSATPRNLVELKNLQLGFADGQVVLTGFDGGAPVNQMVMTTVNGAFQPSVDAGAGGWQSFSFSNMTNNMFYNISFVNNRTPLPIYIYGEDGQQLPQIRWLSQGTLGNLSAVRGTTNPNNTITKRYRQAENLLTLAPGKRVDVLVYLPRGTTEINSTYAFVSPSLTGNIRDVFNVVNMGTYPNLSSNNTLANPSDPTNLGLIGPGPLATLSVAGPVPQLSKAQQDAVIQQANAGILVQEVLPTTRPEEVNPLAVPSVNFFARDAQGRDVWRTARDREFNWTRGTLVGPASEYDAATQAELARIEALPEFQEVNYHYKRYRPLPIQGLLNGVATSNFLTAPLSWLGYDNPLLINDHVFPNGNLTIAQIGTVEQWTLVNWSVAAFSPAGGVQSNQYIGHPFHIHINDFQVEAADTELKNKRNLEDVVMINSSGYEYYNLSKQSISGAPIGIVKQAPLQGELRTIAEAKNPLTVGELATYGANTTKVRMAFQDYLGTYVFHCHILPHEDAGMMQAVMVVENTAASWLAPAEGFQVRREDDGRSQVLQVHQARDAAPVAVRLAVGPEVVLERLQCGDLTGDFVQDLLISSAGDGAVRLIDGASLLSSGSSVVLSRFVPYADVAVAPWAFAEDFDGDGGRDIITGGFAPAPGVVRPAGSVNVHDFTIKGWRSTDGGHQWREAFAFSPWEWIPHHLHAEPGGAVSDHLHPNYSPLNPLSPALTSFTVGDFNLDNFADYALAYAIDGGLRLTILDGQALALALQTGSFEGGYDPAKALLADALLLDAPLHSLQSLVLTSGFNSYAQGAIENLLVTAQTAAGPALYTLALDAGHFIATSEPLGAQTTPPHHGGGGSHPLDAEHVINLESTNYPLHLLAIDALDAGVMAATPVFSGALANGGLLAGERLLVAQGNGANGSASTSPLLSNSAQQLVVDLDGLQVVDGADLIGITDTTPASTFTPAQVTARTNLANLVYTAYCGGAATPGVSAFWAAASLGQGDSAAALVEQFLADPLTGSLANRHFGGNPATTSVASIVTITSHTLYGRAPTAAEIATAQAAVAAGLPRQELPLLLLQSTAGLDRYRVALLSAYSQWSHSQWGTDASVIGSYGQGLQGDAADFALLDQALAAVGPVASWQEAQQLFATLQAGSLAVIGGSQISPVGPF